jgi:thioredoxin 2
MTDSLHLVCPACSGVNRVPTARLGHGPKCGRCGALLAKQTAVEVDQPGFQRFLARDQRPLLVDFWAEWCGPCRMMAPAFSQAAAQLAPTVVSLKLNTEQAQQLSAQLGIRSIPTLALFQNGREIARQSGAMDARSIVAWTRQHLGAA